MIEIGSPPAGWNDFRTLFKDGRKIEVIREEEGITTLFANPEVSLGHLDKHYLGWREIQPAVPGGMLLDHSKKTPEGWKPFLTLDKDGREIVVLQSAQTPSATRSMVIRAVPSLRDVELMAQYLGWREIKKEDQPEPEEEEDFMKLFYAGGSFYDEDGGVWDLTEKTYTDRTKDCKCPSCLVRNRQLADSVNTEYAHKDVATRIYEAQRQSYLTPIEIAKMIQESME